MVQQRSTRLQAAITSSGGLVVETIAHILSTEPEAYTPPNPIPPLQPPPPLCLPRCNYRIPDLLQGR